MFGWLFICFLCFLELFQPNALALISQQESGHIAKCEREVLRLGSEIADHFNAPIGDQDWDERIHQDFIAEHLGFAPMIAHGIQHSNGLTLTKNNAKQFQEKVRLELGLLYLIKKKNISICMNLYGI